MLFTNSFKAEAVRRAGSTYLGIMHYGPDLYDINWLIPLHEAALESDRVKLTPFIPSLDPRLRLEATQISGKSNPIQISTANPHSTSRRSIRS